MISDALAPYTSYLQRQENLHSAGRAKLSSSTSDGSEKKPVVCSRQQLKEILCQNFVHLKNGNYLTTQFNSLEKDCLFKGKLVWQQDRVLFQAETLKTGIHLFATPVQELDDLFASLRLPLLPKSSNPVDALNAPGGEVKKMSGLLQLTQDCLSPVVLDSKPQVLPLKPPVPLVSKVYSYSSPAKSAVPAITPALPRSAR